MPLIEIRTVQLVVYLIFKSTCKTFELFPKRYYILYSNFMLQINKIHFFFKFYYDLFSTDRSIISVVIRHMKLESINQLKVEWTKKKLFNRWP